MFKALFDITRICERVATLLGASSWRPPLERTEKLVRCDGPATALPESKQVHSWAYRALVRTLLPGRPVRDWTRLN